MGEGWVCGSEWAEVDGVGGVNGVGGAVRHTLWYTILLCFSALYHYTTALLIPTTWYRSAPAGRM